MQFLEQFNVMVEGRGLKGAAKDRYEAILTGMVRGIAATQAGAILLSWIKHKTTHRDWVIIIPYSKADEAELGHCNAYALDDLYPVQVGRREIMAVPVRFTAENFMNTCHLGPNQTPLEVLIHELVHAQRMVARIFDPVSLKGTSLDRYDDEEEFFAVMFTNIWSSAHAVTTVRTGNAQGLRDGHDYTQLSSEDPAQFMRDPDKYRLIAKYCDKQPQLTRSLADIQVQFNPFRVYYQMRAKGAAA